MRIPRREPPRRQLRGSPLIALGGLLLAGCSSATSEPGAAPSSAHSAAPSSVASTPAPSSATPAARPPSSPAAGYGGQAVSWPRLTRPAAPPALGAVVTVERVTRSDGGTLAAGLTLPRVGGTSRSPVVLTPCGTRVTVSGALRAVPPSGPGDRLVLLDPGHGGRAEGTHAPDGTNEKDVVLDLARRVRAALEAQPSRVDRVVLTRDRDLEASLPFRIALGDALRADLALSIHLNAAPETTQAAPGTSTYGSLADPEGRRAAGVIYAAVRTELARHTDEVGRWAANRDAGALYRQGRDGRDYYGLLRGAHVTWVIAESLYLSAPREAALIARPEVRADLAGALAGGAVSFLDGATGSGWRRPLSRPADPPAPPAAGSCVDPA